MLFASALIPFDVVIMSVAKKSERTKPEKMSPVFSRCVELVPPGGVNLYDAVMQEDDAALTLPCLHPDTLNHAKRLSGANIAQELVISLIIIFYVTVP